ncbi:hypothetical protein BJ508DRAFT_334359 [Ascobolus immersus RN42]|uniref:Uncharacterized protein n=1 Tax=Ascobolus immersus RN42 TaxID=1160509 RepID=A0A3N4HGD2_ASCIM|nr:hypothetical protein BJ508DRAFT_334359 [Ascobolus immersus RN42]
MPSRKSQKAKAARKKKAAASSASEDASIRKRLESASNESILCTYASLGGNYGPGSMPSVQAVNSAATVKFEAKHASAQPLKPTSSETTKGGPHYPMSVDVEESERFCIGRMGAVLNGKVIDEGWRAGLKELGIEMTIDEFDHLPTERMEELSERVLKTEAYQHMVDYVVEASKGNDNWDGMFAGVPDSAWDIPEDCCC